MDSRIVFKDALSCHPLIVRIVIVLGEPCSRERWRVLEKEGLTAGASSWRLTSFAALEVVGALPGGDSLAAALALGETPSPDGGRGSETGTIQPATSAALLGLFLCLLALTTIMSGGAAYTPCCRSRNHARCGEYLAYVQETREAPKPAGRTP